jgi:hypothetical protein
MKYLVIDIILLFHYLHCTLAHCKPLENRTNHTGPHGNRTHNPGVESVVKRVAFVLNTEERWDVSVTSLPATAKHSSSFLLAIFVILNVQTYNISHEIVNIK